MFSWWIEEVEKYLIRIFDVNGAWESDAIATPTSIVRNEVVGLSSTSGLIGKSKVVATTDETSLSGTSVMGEARALVA